MGWSIDAIRELDRPAGLGEGLRQPGDAVCQVREGGQIGRRRGSDIRGRCGGWLGVADVRGVMVANAAGLATGGSVCGGPASVVGVAGGSGAAQALSKAGSQQQNEQTKSGRADHEYSSEHAGHSESETCPQAG